LLGFVFHQHESSQHQYKNSIDKIRRRRYGQFNFAILPPFHRSSKAACRKESDDRRTMESLSDVIKGDWLEPRPSGHHRLSLAAGGGRMAIAITFQRE
jgi:hypothetical protein